MGRGRRRRAVRAERLVRLGAALALAGLTSGPVSAGEPSGEPEPASPRRLEALWERPAACGSPPPLPLAPPGAGRRLEARPELPACRLSEPEAEPRWWPPGAIWIEAPPRPPPAPR